jgi:hypothetical protein
VSGPRSDAVGEAIARAARTVRAPDELRARLAAPAPPRRARRRPLTHPAVRAAGALALAVTIGVAVVLTTGGAPTLNEVAAAALHPPQGPAKAGVHVGAVAFPDLEQEFGWRWAGQREDEVDGRRAVTVVYRRGARGVHYAIVDGKPLEPPDGARRVRRDGREYAVLREDGVTIVAWEQSGQTCVLASRTMGARGLLRFADW